MRAEAQKPALLARKMATMLSRHWKLKLYWVIEWNGCESLLLYRAALKCCPGALAAVLVEALASERSAFE